MTISVLKIAASLLLLLNAVTASDNGEEARWLVQTSTWGTLSWLEGPQVSSMVTSIGEHEGRLFFYVPYADAFEGSLTLSEAAVIPSQFEGARCGPNGDLDPEDPRCAKLTISGTLSPCGEESRKLGMDALLEKHPQMADWPADHGFVVHEMEVSAVWMIANYGGGGSIDVSDYQASDPVQHAAKGFGTRRRTLENTTSRPDFGDDAAGHARWLVAKSLWTTISTISTRDEGNAFGNIRSVADGACFLSSSGLPYFYLPGPDPSAIDVKDEDSIALSFTEAALPQLVGEDGKICGGADPEDPTCAKISLVGHAVPLEDDDEIEMAKNAFAAQHPRAQWLSGGGAHTGGEYYTIKLENIEFFRNYGGMADVSVDEYLKWKRDSTMFDGEEECEGMNFKSSEQSEGQDYSSYHDGGGHDYSSYHEGGGHDSTSYQHGGEHEHGEWHGEDGGHGEGEMHEHGEWHGHGDGEMHEHGEWHGHGEGEMHEHGDMHEHGEGEAHEYGGHGQGSSSYNNGEDKPSEEDEHSPRSFLFGMGFGLMIWGPTIAVLVYHNSCRCGRQMNRSVTYEPALTEEVKASIV